MASLHKILTNPVYAGAYAYGRTRTEIAIVDGQPRRRSGIQVPQHEWAVLIPEHHEGYIGWEQYQANQKRIAENVHMKGSMRRGAPRKGRSLRAGLLRCRRCGRRLPVTYSGTKGRVSLDREVPGTQRSPRPPLHSAPQQSVGVRVSCAISMGHLFFRSLHDGGG